VKYSDTKERAGPRFVAARPTGHNPRNPAGVGGACTQRHLAGCGAAEEARARESSSLEIALPSGSSPSFTHLPTKTVATSCQPEDTSFRSSASTLLPLSPAVTLWALPLLACATSIRRGFASAATGMLRDSTPSA